MGLLKKLAGQSAIYGVSSILGKSINFLLVPLYTGYLPKEDLGSFTILYALIAFLNVVFTFGMETSFFRFSTGKGLPPEKVYRNTQSLVCLVALALGLILYLAAAPLADFFDFSGKAHLFQWAALILTIDALMAIPFAKLRLDGRAVTFATVKLANIFLNVGFNILFIVVAFHVVNGDILPDLQPWVNQWYRPNGGVDYIVLANVLANFLILPLVWKLVGTWKFELKASILAPMWQYALPLLFMGLAGVTNEVFSRGLFEYALPENNYPQLSAREAGGVFGANFKLAIIMSLIIQAFKYAGEPFFFQQSENKNNPQLFARVMHWFIIFCSALMVAVAVNLTLIGSLFFQADGYEIALPMVPILLMGYLLLGVYYNLSIWFKITDQTRYSFYITFAGAVVTVLIILTLVPVLGFIGGALSTLGCYLTMVILCYLTGQKYYPIPYQTGKGLSYLGTAFLFSYAGFWLDTGNVAVDFLLQNGVFLVFLILIFFMEKKELYSLFHSIRKRNHAN
ncbi:Membrane protein involved in the export of O-antigen and teichoic acid [Cyclobacterium xiamenense]|uniref:Membrane protein involved in the export of O-antigen and teichoic acid n=1 Tax=Cyclobacterium xiamenense TaxID=1297121 RepID=A0A1H7A831_9BACT|nr:polysaccharide biosynthesis C-terminal domain-containing protein [Cyclobacterium xiamenense]SEJ58232.1 Membrane protein involved in the export of O-antigen and teichoic acid [Cyclobacterium xiamenense]